MGWRFRKRIKIFPGFYINISKSGLGLNIGPKGANVSIGPNGTYVNTGIPGTGLYRRDKVGSSIQSSTGIQDKSQNYRGQEVSPNVSIEEQLSIGSIAAQQYTRHMPVSQEDNHNDIYYDDFSTPYDPKKDLENYLYPTIDLLMKHENSNRQNIDIEIIKKNNQRMIEVLMSLGIFIHEIKTTVGPRITLYEIALAPGFSMSRLKGLEDDIALALCSHDVKIMALPDKGTIGIEVPNAKLKVVSVEKVFGSRYFQESFMALPCAIGKTMANDLFMFDLTKAPHVLIGGSTGQGKSVTINAIITSLLYKKHPAELKLVLMDSSGLELSPYSKIANHFLASASDDLQIVTNSSQAVTTLKSLCEEMHARYELLRDATARDIKEYNEKFVNRHLNPANGHKYMPYIVVVIDEYGNFIEERGAEIEQSITRLAQDARAVGIHLIISTNRPTNNVITGAIKANFPTRISFRVPERIDSQVILDCNGAENLLGNGDMLYRAGKGIDCIRIQGAYVDTLEVDRIVNFISDQQGYRYQFELPNSYYNNKQLNSQDIDIKSYDPLLSEAAHAIVITQQGSSSMIQRRFSIGYNRAGRLMEQLENIGVVGAERGSRPRDVLIADIESLNSLLSNKIY